MILIVDDHADTAYVAARLLEQLGYDTVAVAGGREALDYLRSETPKLVILDCHMPCVGGLDVLRAIRADPRLSEVPVVMFSAEADHGARDAFQQLGIQGWIVKASMDWENLSHFARLYG
jgi:two-component system chemotaxis response regulator CheY